MLTTGQWGRDVREVAEAGEVDRAGCGYRAPVVKGAGAHVVLVADPGLPAALAAAFSERSVRVADGLRLASRSWKVDAVCERIGADEQGRLRLDQLARHRPAGASGSLVIGLTDQPRRNGVSPVVAEAHRSERIALACVPSLGALSVPRRLEAILAALVSELAGTDGRRDTEGRRRLGEFRRVEPDDPAGPVRFIGSGVRSRLRLLIGMVRANRPWRLVPSLSGAFAAALGTGGLVLINQTMWKLADSVGVGRLAGAAVLATAAMVAWLMVDHHMWERPGPGQRRPLVRLYNAVTAITLTIGVSSLYAGLFLLGLLAQWVLLDGGVLRQSVGHAATWSLRAEVTWLAASIATVGGALGSGFESDDAVRAAAYGYRQRERRRHQDENG